VTELFEDELVLVAGAGHRLAGRGEVETREVEGESFILFERGASVRRASDEFFKRAGLKPELALESNDTHFIKLMVERGLGVSLLPSWAVREEVGAGRLSELRISGHALTRSVGMISLGRFQPSPTRAFLAYILEHRDQLQHVARRPLAEEVRDRMESTVDSGQ
jgi:DNA-binding transcriptional LysR family regulator